VWVSLHGDSLLHYTSGAFGRWLLRDDSFELERVARATMILCCAEVTDKASCKKKYVRYTEVTRSGADWVSSASPSVHFAGLLGLPPSAPASSLRGLCWTYQNVPFAEDEHGQLRDLAAVAAYPEAKALQPTLLVINQALHPILFQTPDAVSYWQWTRLAAQLLAYHRAFPSVRVAWMDAAVLHEPGLSADRRGKMSNARVERHNALVARAFDDVLPQSRNDPRRCWFQRVPLNYLTRWSLALRRPKDGMHWDEDERQIAVQILLHLATVGDYSQALCNSERRIHGNWTLQPFKNTRSGTQPASPPHARSP